MNNKIKVLHVIDSFGVGGAEIWLLECVKYLYENPSMNYQFDFLLTSGQESVLDKEILKFGSNIFYCKFSKSNLVRFYSTFKIVLTTHKYQVIHNHQDFIAGWHYLFLNKYLPKIRITHLHNPYNFVVNYKTNFLRSFSYNIGKILMFIFSTKITGTSNSVMDEYGYSKLPYSRKRVNPIYCGFNTSKLLFNKDFRSKIRMDLGWNENCKVALFVGRIGLNDFDKSTNQKNPQFAFSLAKLLVQQNSDWNFIFVGKKGRTGIDMEKDVLSNNLNHRIKFLDIRSDMEFIYSASDILIFPSFWEGLGMVSVEAQAAGMNVIQSNSIPSESIVVKNNVVILDLKDNFNNWIEAIISLKIFNNEERKRLNKMVDESDFSISNSVIRLLNLYRNRQ